MACIFLCSKSKSVSHWLLTVIIGGGLSDRNIWLKIGFDYKLFNTTYDSVFAQKMRLFGRLTRGRQRTQVDVSNSSESPLFGGSWWTNSSYWPEFWIRFFTYTQYLKVLPLVCSAFRSTSRPLRPRNDPPKSNVDVSCRNPIGKICLNIKYLTSKQ